MIIFKQEKKMIIVTYGIQNNRHVIFLHDVVFVFRTEVFLFLLLQCPSGNQRKCQGERKKEGEKTTEKKKKKIYVFLFFFTVAIRTMY